MTMSWQAGRQLESITQNGKTYNFTYAHDGLRTKKSITSGNTTVDVNYVYEGDKLLQMTYDNYVLTFSYDANGIPVSFHVKNATLDKDYYYGTNSRGDIEVIYNADGTLHARYDYDAYGKILSVTAPDGTNITAPYAIANLNPLRYRSYVYDKETGLYYLQSRYYDPVTCRFINADAYMSTGQGITGNNMFAYCNNNPVNYSDPAGCMCVEQDGTSMALPYGYGYSNGGGGGGTCGSSIHVKYIQINNYVRTGIGIVGTAIALSYECARQEKAAAKAREREATYNKQNDSKHQKVFPDDPSDFNPKGLVMKVHIELGGLPNGAIYKWNIPGTKISIFEWDEDFIYGPHYHVMKIEWENKHIDKTHYEAGDIIPEPWQSTYFGG